MTCTHKKHRGCEGKRLSPRADINFFDRFDSLTKHIEIRDFYVRELRERKLIDVKWIPSCENLADILNKDAFGHCLQESESVLQQILLEI